MEENPTKDNQREAKFSHNPITEKIILFVHALP
jgi:hypothetical protein